jgi:hypothetical protein
MGGLAMSEPRAEEMPCLAVARSRMQASEGWWAAWGSNRRGSSGAVRRRRSQREPASRLRSWKCRLMAFSCARHVCVRANCYDSLVKPRNRLVAAACISVIALLGFGAARYVISRQHDEQIRRPKCTRRHRSQKKRLIADSRPEQPGRRLWNSPTNGLAGVAKWALTTTCPWASSQAMSGTVGLGRLES